MYDTVHHPICIQMMCLFETLGRKFEYFVQPMAVGFANGTLNYV